MGLRLKNKLTYWKRGPIRWKCYYRIAVKYKKSSEKMREEGYNV